MSLVEKTKGDDMRMMRFFFFIFLALFLHAAPAQAELYIDITRGRADPMPVAMPDFAGKGEDAEKAGREIVQVISNNLHRSGLFKIIDARSYLQNFETINTTPRFQDWRVINSQALVVGSVEEIGSNELKVEFRLWDVFAEQQLIGFSYNTKKDNWRRIAHIISDEIYKRITGESGYFDTRIVYVSETGPLNRRVKRLAIMDQDGANHRFLTDGRHLVLTPRFSPTLQQITYMAYYNNKPRVYLLDIDTGRQEVLGDFPGMTFAPRFSPDGKKVIMSMARNGNSEIYAMDIRSKKPVRLTNHPAIDTSPSYSPEQDKVVFNSDRGGTPQLYVMEADGSDVKRISFGDGRYGTPVWSPRGDLIAFTKMKGGKFYIGVMRPDGSGERLLTESYLDEAPTWSPNGRVLLFFRVEKSDRQGRGGRSRVYSVDLTGFNLREMVTPLDASDPAWSPLIP